MLFYFHITSKQFLFLKYETIYILVLTSTLRTFRISKAKELCNNSRCITYTKENTRSDCQKKHNFVAQVKNNQKTLCNWILFNTSIKDANPIDSYTQLSNNSHGRYETRVVDIYNDLYYKAIANMIINHFRFLNGFYLLNQRKDFVFKTGRNFDIDRLFVHIIS